MFPVGNIQIGNYVYYINNENKRPFPIVLSILSPPDIQAAREVLDINTDPPTLSEVKIAIKAMKSGKAERSHFWYAESRACDDTDLVEEYACADME